MGSKVTYFYDENIGNYTYGFNHPMKPHRIRLTHELISGMGIIKNLEFASPPPITESALRRFHTDDYIHFLENVLPEQQMDYLKESAKFNIDSDSPLFSGIFDYCLSYTGSSLGCAASINTKKSDIAINWSGGLHHAKRGEASGFCYINDIVICILELLKVHRRVLYIDIDVHHGDGVEEAFYLSDRVLTLSLHRYGDFFPGTGHLLDSGALRGKNHSVNVPMEEGTNDEDYLSMFSPILDRCIERFKPEAIVLQCGTDSLAHDRLGCFNLSSSGHNECIKIVKSKGLPLVVLGGGGYTVRNVARCWALETATLSNYEIKDDNIPKHEYYDYYAPDYKLGIDSVIVENKNNQEDLNRLKEKVFLQLDSLDQKFNSELGFEVEEAQYQNLLEEWESMIKENDEYESIENYIRNDEDQVNRTSFKKNKLWEEGAKKSEKDRKEQA